MLFLLSSCKQNNSSLSLLVSTTVVGKENSIFNCYSHHKTYINIDNKLNSTYKAPKKLIYIQGGEVGASATTADHIVNKS